MGGEPNESPRLVGEGSADHAQAHWRARIPLWCAVARYTLVAANLVRSTQNMLYITHGAPDGDEGVGAAVSTSGYQRWTAGVEVRQGTWERPSGIVWDVDGVLIDVSESYPAVVAEAARWFCAVHLGVPSPFSPDHARHWKAAGGFNDDWLLAQAVCLWLASRHRSGRWPVAAGEQEAFCQEVAARGGGIASVRALCGDVDLVRPEESARVCMGWYGGSDACREMFGFYPTHVRHPGLYQRERAAVGPGDLRPWAGRMAIFTGRHRGELRVGLRRADLTALFPPGTCYTADDGPAKPHPDGLLHATRNLGGGLVFVGDDPDDAEATARFNRLAAGLGLAAVRFCGITGRDDSRRRVLAERGADALAYSVLDLLGAWSG